MGRGRKIHPVPYTDSSMSCKLIWLMQIFKSLTNFLVVEGLMCLICLIFAVPPRPMDPKKDLAVYGYGTVAWKERMEDWKKKQNDKLQVVKHGGKGGDNDGDELDDPDLPK